MKQVHHIAIIAQPANVDNMHVDCPCCGNSSIVREDGSVLCIVENKTFAPEPTDGQLHDMRVAFDQEHGIKSHHRQHMVPMMLATSGFDANDPNGGFHPELSGALERLAMGQMLTGGMNRVYA